MKDARAKGYDLEWVQAVFAIPGSKFVTILSIIVAVMIVVLSAAKDHVKVGKFRIEVKGCDLQWMRVGFALFPVNLSFPLATTRVIVVATVVGE